MKKLIIILALFIITMPFYSQTVDTSAWAFKSVGGDGTYRLLENRSTYLGKSAGTVVIPLQFDVNGVDTAKWGFLPIGSDGTFRLVYNKETFYGKDSGTVVAQLVYPTGSPDFVDFGIKNLGAGVEGGDCSWDTTANVIAGELSFTNSENRLMVESSTDSSVITNSYVTANSIVHVWVHNFSGEYFTDGIPIIGNVRVSDGAFTVKFLNISTTQITTNKILTIRFFIIK
jgi:hypothetical protein